MKSYIRDVFSSKLGSFIKLRLIILLKCGMPLKSN